MRAQSLSRLGFFAIAGAASALPRTARAASAHTLRFNCPQAENSQLGIIASRFGSELKRRSNGQIELEVYFNGALASQQGSIDMLGSGALDFTLQNNSLLVPMSVGYQLFDLPFLVPDLPAGYRVLDSTVGSTIAGPLESHGLIQLGWCVSGMKTFETTSKAIVVPEDMKGLRFRIQGGPIYAATYQSLGAIPIVIDVAEIFVALTQHTIDGLDPGLDSFVAGKWYTVCRHVAISNHALAINPMLASKKNISALPEPLQKVVRDAGRAADLYARTVLEQRLADATQFLKGNGVAFTQIQYPAFRKAVEPVFVSAQPKLGTLISRAMRAANAK
jgi:TRAP-type transport system periplasmic protein